MKAINSVGLLYAKEALWQYTLSYGPYTMYKNVDIEMEKCILFLEIAYNWLPVNALCDDMSFRGLVFFSSGWDLRLNFYFLFISSGGRFLLFIFILSLAK